MEYTKGEWAVQTQSDIDKRVFYKFQFVGNQYIANENCVIAQVGKSPDDLTNARLISAAPMLYESVKTLLDMLPEFKKHWHEPYKLQPQLRYALGALAKVEGH